MSGVTRISTEGSSYIETETNYVLLSHVFHSLRTTTLMSCAQMCLVKARCRSFNFNGSTKEDDERNLCELNDFSNNQLLHRKGFIHGRLAEFELENYVFTNLKGKGSIGPTSLKQYEGTTLQGQVKLLNGIQIWKVPYTGKYVIKALGASGGNGSSIGCSIWTLGGKGAAISGTFVLQKGTKLKIIVGQQGLTQLKLGDRPGGGGGGTFVALFNDTPLIVAGGGGGGGVGCRFGNSDGDPGQVGPNGTRVGGSGGSGGSAVNLDPVNYSLILNGGAGFRGDGKKSAGTSSKSFINGGQGGMGFSGNGGFGGGGFGWTHAGGGGGYSGGGAIANSTAAFAGGGGSYNAGTSQENKAGVNKGDGRVFVKCLV